MLICLEVRLRFALAAGCGSLLDSLDSLSLDASSDVASSTSSSSSSSLSLASTFIFFLEFSLIS